MDSNNSDSSAIVKNYGITAAKKAMLHNLVKEAANANYEVEKYQAKASSLTDKVDRCRLLSADAELMRSKAKGNKEQLDQLMHLIAELQSQSEIVNKEMVDAGDKTTALFKELHVVMQKLIYAGLLVNKLFNAVIRKKALNPLISDELIYRINTAVTDTNNAVALTLVALKSACAAYATNAESESAAERTHKLSVSLFNSFTGKAAGSIDMLFNELYDNTKAYCVVVQTKLAGSTNQLNEALLQLNTAQIKLKSLQKGLSAANAAALAM